MRKIFFNKALKILLITNGMILFAAAMMGPIYALFVEEIGGDLLDAGITGAIFAFAAGAATFISGRYADRVKENELIIVLGYLLIALGFFLYLFVKSIWLLFLVQILLGFGEAIYSPAFDAVYSKHIDHHKSGMQWGAWESMNYFVLAFGAFIGAIIVNYFGFQLIFVLMMLLSAASGLFILFLPRKVL